MTNAMLCLARMLTTTGKTPTKDASTHKERSKRSKKTFIIILKIEAEKLY